MTTLIIVIPAYNEEKGIAEIVTGCLSVREKLAAADVELLELLVVDDGSKDRTAADHRGDCCNPILASGLSNMSRTAVTAGR